MGLFSFLNKNKQETTGDDGGYVSRDEDEDAIAARARSKRASSAGDAAVKGKREAQDPVLPEKKRARRRLVGAIALALGVAIGLPMILDSEPKPIATDIDIRIPSRDKAAPLPKPAPVAAVDALDKREEIVDAPKPAAAVSAPVPVPLVTLPREGEARPAKPEHKPEVKPEVKPKPEKLADKPADKLPVKPTAKPAPDAERALAILEDKPVPASAAPAGNKVVLQVAALAGQDKANDLQARLKKAGIVAYTQKGSGDLVRVRVGPYSKEEADKVRAKLAAMDLSGSVVPN
jgi:DedD protein